LEEFGMSSFRIGRTQIGGATLFLAWAVFIACGPDASLTRGASAGTIRTGGPSFFEFRASLPQDPNLGYYIVEGDMLMSEEGLRYHYDQRVRPNALNLSTTFGVENKWSDTEKLALSYCVSQSFTVTDRPKILKFMAQAAAAWNCAANVRICHATTEDSKCNTTSGGQQPNVMFRVWPSSGGSSATLGPHGGPAGGRYVRLDPQQANLRGVTVHEVGHLLGFAHEFLSHPDSICGQSSDLVVLTPYDVGSIMQYANCTPGALAPTTISRYDHAGAEFVYGPRPVWFSSFGTRSIDEAMGVAVGELGDVFVVGYTQGSLGGSNGGGQDGFIRAC
jgi:hypothetical protein